MRMVELFDNGRNRYGRERILLARSSVAEAFPCEALRVLTFLLTLTLAAASLTAIFACVISDQASSVPESMRDASWKLLRTK
jgi:hypothetical protein